MVRAGCVFVAGIHPSRTWTSGSFESVRWNACVHRPDLGLYSHPKEFLEEWSLNPCKLQGKNPLYWKMSPEDRTRDTVDSEPKHYQLSYSGPKNRRRWCKRDLNPGPSALEADALPLGQRGDKCSHSDVCQQATTSCTKVYITQMISTIMHSHP